MARPLAKFVSLLTPKRRWAQFSLGTMFFVLTGICVWLADFVSPVRRLERQLRDPNEVVREEAAERLGYLGPEARSTSESLRRAADDESSSVRATAVWALSRVSGRTDLLAPLLNHPDDDVRLAAAEGILWTGGDPAKVLPTLLDLDGQTDDIFEAMSAAQAAIVVPLLLDALRSAYDAAPGNGRDPAGSALGHVCLPAPTVVPALVDRLVDERPEVRTAAAEQLMRLGETANQAASALQDGLLDLDPACATACAAALCAVDPSDDLFLPYLKRALRADDLLLNYKAAQYVCVLGPKAAAAADDLAAFLSGRGAALAYAAYYSPFPPKRPDPADVPALDRTLRQAMAERDRWPRTPQELRERLEYLASTAVPILQRALERQRGAVEATEDTANVGGDPLTASPQEAMVSMLQWALEQATALAAPNRRAAEALGSLATIGPAASPAVPTLVAALDYADFRAGAMYALGYIGKDAMPAVGRLLPFLDSEDKWLRNATLHALQQIGVSDEAVRAKLRRFLTGSDRYECASVALALAKLGEPVEQVFPTLIELATDAHFGPTGEGLPLGDSYMPDMHGVLVEGMASLGPPAVPELTAALQNGDPKVRRVAAEVLGQIGPAAGDAVPFLIALLDDEPSWDAVAEALGRIGAPARAAVPKLREVLQAMQLRHDSSQYDSGEDDPSEYGSNGYGSSEYLPRLHALAGIGTEARAALPEILRLTNSENAWIRQDAVLALARIDPANGSLMVRMRRLLLEWERKSATKNVHVRWLGGDPREQVADAVWELGAHAEPLVPDLKRIVTTAPLVPRKVRCYAAFALARFAPQRQAAESYLEQVSKTGADAGLAQTLLQRTKANQESNHK